MNRLLLDALRGENRARPPIWLMRQVGRYMPSYRAIRQKNSFLDLCHQPELIVKVTRLAIDEFDMDAAILFSDILLLLEGLGFPVHFQESLGPIIDNALASPSELHRIVPQQIEGNLPFLAPAIQELKKGLMVPLIGFTGAPFTLASYLIEGRTSKTFSLTKRWAYQDPESFDKLIRLIEEATIILLKMQIKAGCDVVQLFDSWAYTLTKPHFEKWSVAPLKRIAAALKPYGVPLIYFCKGSSFRASMLDNTGIDALSVDAWRPIKEIRNELPKLTLQGNLDPEALYLPEKHLEQEVNNLLHSMKGDPSFIFNLGHGILPDIPYQNVAKVVSMVKNSSF